MKPKATELAHGKWPGILVRLGIDARVLDGRNHACPRDGEGKDRFRFTDRNGSGSYFCHCDDGEFARTGRAGGIGLLRCCRGWSYQQACEEVEKIVGTVEATPVRRKPENSDAARKRKILATCKPCGEAVTAYLASRGVKPTTAIRQGRATYWETSSGKPEALGEFDVMVARMKAPDGTEQALHVTYLADGKKANVPSPRKLVGCNVPGSAIRLFNAAPVMGVAEGIETALSAAAKFDVPVWACHCDSMLAGFIPPPCVEQLWIFGDSDANGAGQVAAYKLKGRMHKLGIDAIVKLPSRDDTDWNDELQEAA